MKRLSLLLPWLLIWCLQGCEQQSQFEWHLQSYASPSSVEYQELIRMSKRIKLMSQGRLLIHPHPGGEITGGADIYTAVKERRVEMGNGWPNWWSRHHPGWFVMNGGPYEFMNLDASMLFFTQGAGRELATSLAHQDGIIWRPAWWAGMEFGLLSKEPIKGLADLKGKHVRIGPGLPSDVLTNVSGATSIPLVPAEIRAALNSGDIDAVEWTTTAGAWNLGLADIAHHAIVPAIWQPAVLSDFLINQQAFDELPQSLQQVLLVALESYTLNTTTKSKKRDIEAYQLFLQQGTEFSSWSEEDLAAFKTASDAIYEKYRQQGDMARQVLDAKAQFKAEYDRYYEVFGAYD